MKLNISLIEVVGMRNVIDILKLVEFDHNEFK